MQPIIGRLQQRAEHAKLREGDGSPLARDLADAAEEIARLRCIVEWCKRRMAPTYHQYVDGMLAGELPAESKLGGF